MVTVEELKKKKKKDPYQEILETLEGYDEGLPARTPEKEECSCRMEE